MSEQNPDLFRRRFLQLSIVNVLSNIMIPLAGIVDVAFLGHLADLRHLAGVALATILFDFLYRTCKFLRMGTTGATAQASGRSDRDEVLLTLLRNSVIALSVTLVILLFQHPLRELGFFLLNGAPEVEAAGRAYYNARIWGAPAVLLNYVAIGWFLGREQSSKVLAFSVVGNAANVVLDYLLIFRWGWDSSGAGIATAASQYLMLLLAFVFIVSEGWLARIPAVARRIFNWDAMKATFELNADIWIRTLASVMLYALFLNLSSFMGTLVLASNSLLVEVVNLAIFLIEGSAFATETLAGNFYGIGLNAKLPSLLRLSGIISLGIGLTFASLFIFVPGSMFGLLTNHLEAIEEIHHYVLWLLPIIGVLSLVYMLEGYFLGLTKASIIRNSMIIALVFAFLPVAIVAWRLENIQILWLGLLLFMVARAVTLGWYVPQSFSDFAPPTKNCPS